MRVMKRFLCLIIAFALTESSVASVSYAAEDLSYISAMEESIDIAAMEESIDSVITDAGSESSSAEKVR